MSYEIIHADVLEALKKMPDASFDACLTDPPYALGTKEPTVEEIIAYLTGARLDTGGDFMSKKWDLPSVAVWKETIRVLRPGAHVLAFGGSRMFDMLTIGIRAAEFEVRDVLSWMYSTGFPKSFNLGKAIDAAAGAEREVIGEKMTPDGKPYSARRPNSEGRYHDNPNVAMNGSSIHDSSLTAPATPDAAPFEGHGTALKPAWEPIVLARKSVEGTIAANALAHGTGGLNVDGTRIGWGAEKPTQEEWNRMGSSGAAGANGFAGQFNQKLKDAYAAGAVPVPEGRFPANVVLSHLSECRPVGTKHVKSTSDYDGGGSRQPGFADVGSESGNGAPVGRGYAGPDGTEEVEAWDCPPWCPVAILDAQSGDRPGMSGGGVHRPDYGGGMFGATDSPGTARADSGGASRFFATFPADDPEYAVLRGGDPESIAGTYASKEEAEQQAALLGNGSHVVPVSTGVPTFPANGVTTARFFYSAKASRAEREFGCENLPARTAIEAVDREPDSAGAKNPRAGAGRGAGAVRERCGKCGIPVGSANHEGQRGPCVDGGEHEAVVVGRGELIRNVHPTVKPIALARWLATLLLPPPLGRPRRILVLYAGSGSEMIGAMRAGWDEIVGVEREPVKPDSPDYVGIARARLARWSQVPAKMSEQEVVGESRSEGKKVLKGQTTLF